MGLGMEIMLIGPFALFTFIGAAITTVASILIDKFILYKGPEDEELWDEDHHFKMQ